MATLIRHHVAAGCLVALLLLTAACRGEGDAARGTGGCRCRRRDTEARDLLISNG
ncbi:MAG: hypothetical protein R3E65_09645 [Steroidobacteraceae bacterium]